MTNHTILLTQRLSRVKTENCLLLPLSAHERTQLRGLRKTRCGKEVLLQLPRTGPLIPGEILSGEFQSLKVQIEAAIEELIQVQSHSPLELIKASYHLGNRHVELELQSNNLFLLKDPVIEKLLLSRGLNLKIVRKAFFPELGAYSSKHIHYFDQ